MSEADGTEIRTPFVDDSLLEQRQQQREVLLSIPKWLADEARAPSSSISSSSVGTPSAVPPAPVTPAQRILIERHARDRVDGLLDQLQDSLAPVVDRGVAETIAAHLDAVLSRKASKGATAWRSDLADELDVELDVDRDALGELVDLLLMADGLANDGFADTRFQ